MRWPSVLAYAALAAALSLPGRAAEPAKDPCDSPERVRGRDECLVARTFGKAGPAGVYDLFVLLHGNHSDGSPATSMFAPAAAITAGDSGGTVAVALLRPGYPDAEGAASTGDIGQRADNFHAGNVDEVAAAIETLKRRHKPRRVILVGHSGGAAIAGVILGRHPGLARAALLLGCPCDVPAWRMARGRYDAWRSLSPHDAVDRIPAGTRVHLLVGSRDDVTPPALSDAYVKSLMARDLPAAFAVVDGATHTSVIRDPVVVKAARNLMRD